MWNYLLTGYILGTAIFLFLCVLGLILPSLIFGNRVIEKKVDSTDDGIARKKIRIDERARFYQEKYRQL